MHGGEHTLLIVDVMDEPGRTFRSVPTGIQSVENNRSIANLDFADFVGTVDPDGVYRGM